MGKTRRVVERTISWLKGLRRMRVRYDWLGVIQDAWGGLRSCHTQRRKKGTGSRPGCP
jgi:hypothetical protein